MSPRRALAPATLVLLIGVAAVLAAGFTALGVWQLQRRVWKLELIERVAQRVHAAPVAAPGPGHWQAAQVAKDSYRRVQLTGHYQHSRSTRVQALTELGSGHWLMTPLRSDQGFTVLVNRGFLPDGQTLPNAADNGDTVQVIGLLRDSEPGGGFLRQNDPAAGRWYSRDVTAIARTLPLEPPVAPYFVDTEAAPGAEAPPTWPRPGLTVLQFRNHHLGYALTWFVLAAMAAGAGGLLARSEWRLRRGGTGGGDPDEGLASGDGDRDGDGGKPG